MPVYDIIGDIHGHADALEALLDRLGYRETGGAYRQPGHHAVFLGDFVDRGPRQLRVLEIARRMLDAGTASAIQGNHEFNAICWATPSPLREGAFIRPHKDANRYQHRAFLEAVGEDSPLHREMVSWFRTLPLWLELPGFRAVHACWHPGSMVLLRPWLDDRNCLTQAAIDAYAERGSPVYLALETVLKGIEVELPPGVTYFDGYGQERRISRVRWWDRAGVTYRSAALVAEHLAARIPDTPLPADKRVDYDGAKPVFFGHYWMRGEPYLVAPDMACLDFSVAKDGWLCAYSFDGEPALDPDRLVAVRPVPEPAFAP